MDNNTNILKELFEKYRCPLKAKTIIEAGIDYRQMLTLEEKGELIRHKNGYYIIPGLDLTAEEIVSGLFEDGVLTMDTALYYQGYIDVCPDIWSIAISKNTSKSRFKMENPQVKPFYTEPRVLKIGVEKKEHFRLYNIDRLICEILKYESKISKKLYRQAVKAYIDDSSKDVNRLIEYALERKVLKKVETVILPWVDHSVIIPTKKHIEKPEKEQPEEITEEITKEITKELTDELTEQYAEELVEQFAEESVEQIAKEPPIPRDTKKLYDLLENWLAHEWCKIIALQNVNDMEIIADMYNVIYTRPLRGKLTWRCLEDELEDIGTKNIPVINDIISKIKNDKNLSIKWDIYRNRQNKSSYTWEEIIVKIEKFFSPIHQAIENNEGFVGDWLPEIERYL